MKVSDLMRAMSEAGAPMDAILIAVEALESKQAEIDAAEAAKAQKRAKDAARKRAERAANLECPENVHGQSTDTARTVQDAPALSPSPKEINSNPHPHTHPEETPRARKADNFPCPDWAEPQVWRDLKTNRRTKRLSNTPTAHRQFVRAVEGMADDAWPPGRLLEAIVAKGWGGAHDPREDRKPSNDYRSAKPTGTATAAQRAIASLGG